MDINGFRNSYLKIVFLFIFYPRAPDPKRTGTGWMGFYFFAIKKVNKKIFAKNKLYGVSMNVSALITHFGGVLPEDVALMNSKFS